MTLLYQFDLRLSKSLSAWPFFSLWPSNWRRGQMYA